MVNQMDEASNECWPLVLRKKESKLKDEEQTTRYHNKLGNTPDRAGSKISSVAL